MKIREVNENKKQFIALLLLADEQENMIDHYLEIGTVEMLLACKYITTPVVLLYRFRILIHNFG